MNKNVLLLTLQTFSTTGGIQKMTRTLGYSLCQLARTYGFKFRLWSLYDTQESVMSNYVIPENFRGFSYSRFRFMLANLKEAAKVDHLILSHINLAMVGVMVKLINPSCKVYLIAHGIEVWRPLSALQRLLLKKCDQIFCVSAYTQQQIIKRHQVNTGKTRVLNNALDPFMLLPAEFHRPAYLAERYHLKSEHQIVFTLTRLASTEQYKGYEQVIQAVARLKATHPNLIYILAGQYDAAEEKRINQLVQHHGVQEQVLVTGFIPDHELSDHFLLADLFVLPSKKEGFGLVFIEALACGLPVICGNADGSKDAIKNGELGQSINADDVAELQTSIAKHLAQPVTVADKKLLQTRCTGYFNELQYRSQLWNILNDGPATR